MSETFEDYLRLEHQHSIGRPKYSPQKVLAMRETWNHLHKKIDELKIEMVNKKSKDKLREYARGKMQADLVFRLLCVHHDKKVIVKEIEEIFKKELNERMKGLKA